METGGDGVRLRSHIGQWNEPIRWRGSSAGDNQRRQVRRNAGVAAQPRLRILTQGMNYGSAFDQIVTVRIQQRFEGHTLRPSRRLDHQRSAWYQPPFHWSNQRLIQRTSVPLQRAEFRSWIGTKLIEARCRLRQAAFCLWNPLRVDSAIIIDPDSEAVGQHRISEDRLFRQERKA